MLWLQCCNRLCQDCALLLRACSGVLCYIRSLCVQSYLPLLCCAVLCLCLFPPAAVRCCVLTQNTVFDMLFSAVPTLLEIFAIMKLDAVSPDPTLRPYRDDVIAALATQAGFPRNRRVLPDKRARRRPGWLHNTIHLRPAADPPAAEVAFNRMLHHRGNTYCLLCVRHTLTPKRM